MPRFVVLAHDWPTSHFDFLLEDGESCLTWRLPDWPPKFDMPIERLQSHRLDYLTYEGAVRNNRGTVRRVEEGHYEWLDQHQIQPALQTKFRIRITAQSWCGELELTDRMSLMHYKTNTESDAALKI